MATAQTTNPITDSPRKRGINTLNKSAMLKTIRNNTTHTKGAPWQ